MPSLRSAQHFPAPQSAPNRCYLAPSRKEMRADEQLGVFVRPPEGKLLNSIACCPIGTSACSGWLLFGLATFWHGEEERRAVARDMSGVTGFDVAAQNLFR